MKRILSIFILVVSIISLTACSSKNDVVLKEEDLRAVCDLATLKCYYNNVAEIIKEKDSIFQKDRKMWIEYEGEATIGIDMSELTLEISEEKVKISMPAAKILSIKPVYETLNEKSYISSVDGIFFKNKITTENQEEAINKGQIEMETAVLNNTELFAKAEKRAKELIENYITSLSKVIGKEYLIEWVS